MKQFTIILFFAFPFCFAACQSNDDASKSAEDTQGQEDKVEVLETAQSMSSEAQKVRYLETAIGKVPVYDTFEGVQAYFEKSNDTTYVINFWATWCKPCVEELPYFEQIQSAYKDQKVQVVLISMDFERALEKKLIPFLADHQLKSEVVVLVDNKYNNWIDRVDESWGGAIPVTMIYNAQQKKFFGEQFDDFADLEGALKKFL
ncbi:MAG: TlpA disulfide reductase family protein [Bacteroidota bacterium]